MRRRSCAVPDQDAPDGGGAVHGRGDLVGGAGAVVRGVEARGAGARPPPAPLQALQLLLLRPPAQHLRLPEGGAGPVGVRERQLPARRAGPPVGHPSPQVNDNATVVQQVRRRQRRERGVPSAVTASRSRVDGHHVWRRRRQRAQLLIGVVAATSTGRPAADQRERAAQEGQPHAVHGAGAGAPPLRGAAGLPLALPRRPAARPTAAHAGRGGRRDASGGRRRWRRTGTPAPRSGQQPAAGARRRRGGREEREAVRRTPQGRRRRRKEEGPVRGGGGQRAAHQDDQGRRAVGRRAVVGPGAELMRPRLAVTLPAITASERVGVVDSKDNSFHRSSK